eukprot:TRINITY_DN3112_c0_g2_i6.p1 TRINITY_DN3112_c0_g2~~TRINITY_DN3112_c0_g2_i6.p1  ORF type:complete len:250 (+),score=44.84 TRINITY_DN3112_c0_g2_i6:504-1253(+)
MTFQLCFLKSQKWALKRKRHHNLLRLWPCRFSRFVSFFEIRENLDFIISFLGIFRRQQFHLKIKQKKEFFSHLFPFFFFFTSSLKNFIFKFSFYYDIKGEIRFNKMAANKMQIYSLYIVNKAGSVVYYQNYQKEKTGKSNDYLRYGSIFHGLFAIGSQLSPVPSPTGGPSSGIQLLQTDTFRLQAYQTPTGVKFFGIAEPTAQMEGLLKQVYVVYTDYVLKNPFYEIDQPIRCEQFDISLDKLVSGYLP